MDPNLKKTILNLKEKQKNPGPTVDCVELERCLREFKTELYIKRDEVNQLRTELDAVNLEMQNLKKTLDMTKKTLDENQFNLTLQLKKARNNDEELKEKRESLMKIQLQHKMAIAEVDLLKETIHKTEMEKTELSRKVDVFEAKQRHNSVYHNEILKRDNHLRNFMGNVNDMITKLQADHAHTIELSKKTQLANDSLEKLNECVIENEKLRKEKQQFEEMYIRANAKYEKLEELMAKDVSLNTPNLLTKVIFNQWKLNKSHYEEQMNHRNGLLDTLTESFTNEKNTNIKLIKENENIKEMYGRLKEENLKLQELYRDSSENINVLEKRIKLLQQHNLVKDGLLPIEESEIQIKNEPIQID